ncbi:hypothetical protein ECG_08458 [Echinococcus granulosus]|uniref:Expressed protein n=1 Tax=Echinococcus granulosus TaxID=6210 RepID=A0A068WLI4_ECHGR|nr:hypothetical protein ECG_08458 [Echinococcus granulosus]CDS20983.1 expressed protein [Echinococcus granulosus]
MPVTEWIHFSLTCIYHSYFYSFWPSPALKAFTETARIPLTQVVAEQPSGGLPTMRTPRGVVPSSGAVVMPTRITLRRWRSAKPSASMAVPNAPSPSLSLPSESLPIFPVIITEGTNRDLGIKYFRLRTLAAFQEYSPN